VARKATGMASKYGMPQLLDENREPQKRAARTALPLQWFHTMFGLHSEIACQGISAALYSSGITGVLTVQGGYGRRSAQHVEKTVSLMRPWLEAVGSKRVSLWHATRVGGCCGRDHAEKDRRVVTQRDCTQHAAGQCLQPHALDGALLALVVVIIALRMSRQLISTLERKTIGIQMQS